MAEWATAEPGTEAEITAENWQAMEPVERYIFHLTTEAAVSMDNPEPGLIIDWCVQQAGDAR